MTCATSGSVSQTNYLTEVECPSQIVDSDVFAGKIEDAFKVKMEYETERAALAFRALLVETFGFTEEAVAGINSPNLNIYGVEFQYNGYKGIYAYIPCSKCGTKVLTPIYDIVRFKLIVSTAKSGDFTELLETLHFCKTSEPEKIPSFFDKLKSFFK